MHDKIWEYRNKQLKKEDITNFANCCKIPPAIAVILLNRGITDSKAAASFLKKGLDGIHDPFLLNDMDAAADRIIAALSSKEKITVYGDYDADGVTSTAVLYGFLKKIGANVEYYIPDRFKEGYGLNIPAINRIARGGSTLMITVDCGITSVGETEFAKTQGLDVIITDHHTCKDTLPRAAAVINAKRADSTYPFPNLAGVGTAFKLVLALAVRMGFPTKDIFYEYADVVSLGTIADVVPLLGENRIITDRGITAISGGRNNGIRALLEASGIGSRTVDSTTVAFTLAPRLNVAGRLAHAKTAVELLTEPSYDKALETALFLNETNRKRQQIEQEIFSSALEQAMTFDTEQHVYVLSGEGWHPGVIGIVASRLCEHFYRPCILISCENGKGKGSGRSIEEMNLFDALSDSEDILTAFGGHAQAAGLSIPTDRIEAFRQRINAYAKSKLTGKQLMPNIKIDCPLSPESITLSAAKMISRLEPFGCGNENPVFSLSNAKITQISPMGADGRHLRLRLSCGGYSFSAAGFGMGGYCGEFKLGDTVNAAFNMNVNTYQGSENLQLLIKDIKKQIGMVV
ncbi:MAG: single-stranded-DNA-specific exonuclease RecJ [Clostridiales bacterium]|nr:single-stranded-DNA-specific exonuclease RecJ [Clostridiales bacterium]